MGYLTIDVMPESYQIAMANSQAGDILGPFAVDHGFAVVKVEDRRREREDLLPLRADER